MHCVKKVGSEYVQADFHLATRGNHRRILVPVRPLREGDPLPKGVSSMMDLGRLCATERELKAARVAAGVPHRG